MLLKLHPYPLELCTSALLALQFRVLSCLAALFLSIFNSISATDILTVPGALFYSRSRSIDDDDADDDAADDDDDDDDGYKSNMKDICSTTKPYY